MTPRVVIVCPARRDDNNGNWQTAWRWQRMLRSHHPVRIVHHWPDGPRAALDQIMLALHARRSASAIVAWSKRARAPGEADGLAVVLTGTDLYQDILHDTQAQASLDCAQILVTLQELGPLALPPALRGKARVMFQSTTARQRLHKTDQLLRVAVVGHLRDVKMPQTVFAAARLLRDDLDIRIDHIGAPLDPLLADQARYTAATCPGYRWHGVLPHGQTRRWMQRAHLLLHPSRIEGGAHVVMEAICSGTPVLASDIAGNVGMLGADYAGLFPPGDAQHLARQLHALRLSQTRSATQGFSLQALMQQCARRAGLFTPQAERAALMQLVDDLSH